LWRIDRYQCWSNSASASRFCETRIPSALARGVSSEFVRLHSSQEAPPAGTINF
jgi:hypothetical protein